MKPATYAFLIFSMWFGFAMPAQGQAVQARLGTIDLPTYLLGEEDPNPPFPLVNRHNVYPYTMLDDLTDRLETKSYRAVFLENEYLRAIVLPEMGGRLYSLYDKVSKREVFYRNHVVKYGLVALRGAWISGGIEFNFPDGHTVVTVSPVASTLRQNPDGSATAVVGDMDQVTGMHWEVALTLRPGQARLEQHVTLFNATPLTNLYWYWANAAVPATDDMQFIYPMREAYPHMHGVVWNYPMHEGVDHSWYKNVRQPTSLFGRQVHRTFFGAYYHNAEYGVVHAADFREVPGKKIWTWGVAGDGLIWTDLLSDRDGPYNEIQSGRYETQLNYEFMAPHRVESWTEYWYPVRDLNGGFVEATRDLALNARTFAAAAAEKQHVELSVCPTVEINGAKVRVKLGTQLLREFGPLAFKPPVVLKFGVPVEDLEAAKANLAVEIASADGHVLLRWSASDPVDGNRDFVPGAGARAPRSRSPASMTVEELFREGVAQEKDGKDEAAAETYGQVLERDPGYIPALLKMAWGRYRAADFPAAEGFIARALGRDATDPAVHYAAGVIYRGSERWTLAADAFWAAIHFGGPPAPAFVQLGELSIRQKNYEEAAKLLRQALAYDPEDALARTDLAVALRLAGKINEAGQAVAQALEKMPLLPFALAEQGRISEARGKSAAASAASPAAWAKPLPADVQNYLEVAAWYRGLDDLPSSDAVLHAAEKLFGTHARSPLVYYYLASNARREGQDSRAEEYAAKAAAAPHAKVFPHRLADALAVNEALQRHPLDAHAQYFVGNFLFARGRYEEASAMWFQALGEGFEYSVLARNLGLYAWRVKKDLTGAAGFYAKAIQLAPDDYRLYTDLDEIYFQAGDISSRAKLFAQAPAAVLERDTVRVRRAFLLVQQRQYEQALELLMAHRFKPWEGGEIVRQIFVLANLELGRAKLAAGKSPEAEQAFRRAMEYPPNLGVGKPDKTSDEEALFWLGEASQAAGNAQAAHAAWQQAASGGKEKSGTSRVFQALALRRLGRTEEAEKILSELLQAAAGDKPDAYSLYVAGLVERSHNHPEAAQKNLRRALEVDPTFWLARIELERGEATL